MHLYQIDAFTTTPFSGNPAAVCLLAAPRPDNWLRQVAAEMNLSETAFPLREGERWRLRWFTPATEVSLCGHATLATAHALWSEGHAPADQPIYFDTLSGQLVARRHADGIELDFPTRAVSPAEPPPQLVAALGATPVSSYAASRPSGPTYLLELASAAEVRALAPDFSALLQAPAKAVIVTAPSDDPAYDFVSRFFAPALGINEDPVTGSAHCYLAPFWAQRLGKNSLRGHQASARGGMVGCEWMGDRVLLRGQAVTVLRGELLA
jgi:PhzF family phenazine biosynthesis protein